MQGKVKRKTLGPLKSNIDNLNSVKPKHGSVSGAVARHVRRWVRTLPADQLEFYALHLPKEPWRRLADVCHFNPEKDFPNLPWFLRYCYGDAAPDGSMVKSCGHLNAENVNELVKGHDVPYAHLKELNNHLDDVSKARIASYEDKLDTLLWYYEELACEAVDQVIMKRMERGDAVTLPYGKLMERLLTLKIMRENIDKPGSSSNGSGFSTGSTATEESLNKAPFYHLLVPIAEKMLRNISVPLETPVVVIGDASPSMNVAIRTSTIIASLLSAIAHAQLVFFNTYLVKPPFLPESVTQALELAVTVKTDHMTAPAAALKPFYDKKEVVKTFVIVTDECENTSCDGYRFAPLFKKYQEEVYPAKLVFVSFLSSQHSQGSMITALKNLGISALQFKLDSNRPDLSKLDNLLGIFSTQDMVSFDEQVSIMKEKVKVQGILCAFRKTDSDITAVENHDELDNGEYKEDEDTDGIKIDKVKGDENESTQMKNDATKEDQSASVNDIDGALCEKSDAMNENATSDSMNGWVHVKEEDWGTEDF
uniref:Uncharacterized protein LOC100371489 n=1 Tax=Saccoglossus kowalevskii TaxID=10224 RepID=A0ABM0MT07_SACKO|nr:PREDICTED: uncharacterized protein LOC100371489 [Saccoglossus kowalevskii]